MPSAKGCQALCVLGVNALIRHLYTELMNLQCRLQGKSMAEIDL